MMNLDPLIPWIAATAGVLGAIGAAVFGDAGIVLDVLAGGGLGAITGQAIVAFGGPRQNHRPTQIVARWTAMGAVFALLINLAVEVL